MIFKSFFNDGTLKYISMPRIFQYILLRKDLWVNFLFSNYFQLKTFSICNNLLIQTKLCKTENKSETQHYSLKTEILWSI